MAEQGTRRDLSSHYQTVSIQALASLAKGDVRPETLHRLRTHLRRLQAFLELVGEDTNACVMADCVSRFSRLRTLQVLEQYLKRIEAPASDVKAVQDRIRSARRKLARKQAYREVERLVRRHAIPPMPAAGNWLAMRMGHLRDLNATALHDLAAKAAARPRRKRLHALRLKIKSVRYQEEWALHEAAGRPALVAWLKKAQTVLGEYEERGQFRKLARTLPLHSARTIEKAWRKARKRARALPEQIIEHVTEIAPRPLRLVRSEQAEQPAAM